MLMNKKGLELYEKFKRLHDQENLKRLNQDLKEEGWCIIENDGYIKTPEDAIGLYIYAYDTEIISVVKNWIEGIGESINGIVFNGINLTHGQLLKSIPEYYDMQEWEEEELMKYVEEKYKETLNTLKSLLSDTQYDDLCSKVDENIIMEWNQVIEEYRESGCTKEDYEMWSSHGYGELMNLADFYMSADAFMESEFVTSQINCKKEEKELTNTNLKTIIEKMVKSNFECFWTYDSSLDEGETDIKKLWKYFNEWCIPNIQETLEQEANIAHEDAISNNTINLIIQIINENFTRWLETGTKRLSSFIQTYIEISYSWGEKEEPIYISKEEARAKMIELALEETRIYTAENGCGAELIICNDSIKDCRIEYDDGTTGFYKIING